MKTIKTYVTNICHGLQNTMWDILSVFLYVIFLTLFVNFFILQSFRVVSGSMMPTLYDGDLVLVGKWSYGYSRASFPDWLGAVLPDMERFLDFNKPQRGDVVVIKSQGKHDFYVKRIIGIPGDRIQISDGKVWINDQILPQLSYADYASLLSPQPRMSPPRVQQLPARITMDKIFVESNLRNYPYYIIDQRRTSLDDTGVFVLTDNDYFVLGDNRDNSNDSRTAKPLGLGLIPLRQIVGKVLWLRVSWWPLNWLNVQ